MRACAYPVASADSPMASPAPMAIKPVSIATPSGSGLNFACLVLSERSEWAAAADEERTEELHVLQPQRLDHRAERSQSQVEGVEEGGDENADPDRPDRAQFVGDVREVSRCQADSRDPQVGENVADPAQQVQRPGGDAERSMQRHDEDQPDRGQDDRTV